MRIAEVAVRRPQFTLVVFILLVALGINTLLTIPKAEDPSFPMTTFVVAAVLPGASPEDVEKLVVERLEEAIAELDDLVSIKTRIADGVGVIRVEFEADEDADDKYAEVLRQVGSVRSQLPGTLRSLDVNQFSTTNVAILQLALVSDDAPYAELEKHAEALEDRLRTVPGVKTAEVWAIPEQQVSVVLDAEKLAELGVAPTTVAKILEANGAVIPGGSVEVGRRRFNVETSGSYADLEELKATPVLGAGGNVVTLGDLAEVTLGHEEQKYLARFNQRRAAFVTVEQKDQQDIFEVRSDALAMARDWEKTLPPSIRMEIGFDQSENVAHRLGGLSRDFVIAILLVLLTLLPLGTRASVIVMISIPLSLALGLTMLAAAGYSINQLSIVGFVIALGLLVDDSIVVTENVTRFLRMGHSPREAAILATKQIGVAVLGCTATLVFAFLPILFLPGTAGQFIRSLPLAVVFTILASLLVSITVIPFLAAQLLKKQAPEGNAVYRFFHRGIEASYRPLLEWSLRRPKTTLVGAAALLAGSVALVPAIGFSLFPKAGTPQFLVTVEAPDGSSLTETDRAVRFVEETLARHAEVVRVMSNVGRGNPQVYYNVAPAHEQTTRAEVFVSLAEYDPAETPKLYEVLREELLEYPHARVELKEFENGPALDAPIAIRVLGSDLEQLRQVAGKVEARMNALEGTTYVNNPVRMSRTDLKLRIDRLRAGQLGVQEVEIERAVRLALAGLEVGNLRTDAGDEHAISLRLSGSERPSLDTLDRVYVSSMTGAVVPLREVARFEFASSPTLIERYNEERAVTVTSFVKAGFNTDRVTKALLADLEALALPEGVRLVPAGEIESRKESFGGLGTAILVAAFGVLSILVLEFRTFKSTLIVASVIPLGVVGGLVALFLFSYTLSFTACIGFVALIGIEVKNSVLLVDFTNQLRAEGVPIDRAIAEAGEVRFFPILLTTMTSLGGLIPLAAERSSLYSPLAVVIIGGLISSTVLARLVTPVLYKLLAPEVEMEVVERETAGALPLPVAS